MLLTYSKYFHKNNSLKLNWTLCLHGYAIIQSKRQIKGERECVCVCVMMMKAGGERDRQREREREREREKSEREV